MLKQIASLLLSDKDTISFTVARAEGAKLRVNVLPFLTPKDPHSPTDVERALMKPLCVTATLEDLEGEKFLGALQQFGANRLQLHTDMASLDQQLAEQKKETDAAVEKARKEKENNKSKTPAKNAAPIPSKATPSKRSHHKAPGLEKTVSGRVSPAKTPSGVTVTDKRSSAPAAATPPVSMANVPTAPAKPAVGAARFRKEEAPPTPGGTGVSPVVEGVPPSTSPASDRQQVACSACDYKGPSPVRRPLTAADKLECPQCHAATLSVSVTEPAPSAPPPEPVDVEPSEVEPPPVPEPPKAKEPAAVAATPTMF